MYYANYRGKHRKKRGGGCGGILFRLLIRLVLTALLLALLAAGVLYVLPVSFLNVAPENNDLSLTTGLPADRVNILLLGLDAEADGMQRCDCIMVASVSTDSFKLISFQRDTQVTIPGYSGTHKLNAAYSYGGAQLTMRVINETFGLNITNYIAVDFAAMVDLVDAVNGIDLNVQEYELHYYNRYAYVTYKALCKKNEQKYINYLTPADEVTQAGMQHMDGLHATGYCRIRYVDSVIQTTDANGNTTRSEEKYDYGRTQRQRTVLKAILASMKKNMFDPGMYTRLYAAVTNGFETDLTIPELISLGEKVAVTAFTKDIGNYRVPQKEFVKDDSGSMIIVTNMADVRAGLYNFIYSK